MIDAELIEKKIDMIEEGLTYLHGVKDVDRGEFLSSYEKIQATKHTLQEVIEACLDIANHILAAKGLRRSETYSGMFQVLTKNNIISKDLADKLGEMAKFRNLLVHRYAEVDDERVYEILRESLGNIEKFTREIEKILT